MTLALTCILLYNTGWLTPTMQLVLGPGLELMASGSMLSPSSWQTPSVCEMQLLSPLRVGKEFLEEEPAGPCNWVPHPHAWLSHTQSLPTPPIPLAPSSPQAVSEVWKQESFPQPYIFFSHFSLLETIGKRKTIWGVVFIFS